MNLETLHFQGVEVVVYRHPEFGALLSTKAVAEGYGVSTQAIDAQFARRQDELIEGNDYILVQQNVGNLTRTVKHWTKEGVISLGFFLSGNRAKQFRKWVKETIINHLEPRHDLDLHTPAPLVLAEAILAATKQNSAKLEVLEQRTSLIEQAVRDQPINSIQKGIIHRLGQQWGKSRGSYARAWREFNDAFGLASYRDLPQSRFEEGLAFLNTQIATLQTTGMFQDQGAGHA
jgi:hypothetical protein